MKYVCHCPNIKNEVNNYFRNSKDRRLSLNYINIPTKTDALDLIDKIIEDQMKAVDQNNNNNNQKENNYLIFYGHITR